MNFINKLIKNSLQYISKKLLNYLSIFFLLILSVGVFAGMFNYNTQLDVLYTNAVQNSIRYDTHVNLNKMDLNSRSYNDLASDWIGFSNFDEKTMISDWIEFIDKTNNNNQVCFDSEKGIADQLWTFISQHNLTFKPDKSLSQFVDEFKGVNCNYLIYSLKNILATSLDSQTKKSLNWEMMVDNSADLTINETTYHLINAFHHSINQLWSNDNLNRVDISNSNKTAISISDGEVFVNSYFMSKTGLSNNALIDLGVKEDQANQFKIVGNGYRYSDLMLEAFRTINGNYNGSSSTNFALVYMTDNDFKNIFEYNPALINNYQAYIRFGNNDNFNNSFKELNTLITSYFSTTWNQTIAKYDDFGEPGQQEILIMIDYIIFAVVCFAASLVILTIMYFFIKRDIAAQQQTLGILKSLGYSTWQLAFSIIIPIVLTIILGSILGYIFAFGFASYFIILYKPFALLPFSVFYNNWIIFGVFIVAIPLIFIMILMLITINLLNKNPLTLINNQKQFNSLKIGKKFRTIRKKPLFYLPFGVKIATSFAQKSITKWITTLLTFLFGTLVLFFEFNAIDLFNKYVASVRTPYTEKTTQVIDIPFQFSYQLANDKLEINPDPSSFNYNWIPSSEIFPATLVEDNFDCSWEWANTYMPISFTDQNDQEGKSRPLAEIIKIISQPMMNKCLNGDYLKQVINSKAFDGLLKIIEQATTPEMFAKIKSYLQNAKLQSSIPNLSFGKFIYDSNDELPLLSTPIEPLQLEDNSKIRQATVIGLDQETNFADYYNFADNTSYVNDIFKLLPNSTAIPIVVSKKIWYSNELPLDRAFEWKVKTSPKDYQTTLLQVVGYTNNDTTTNNIYMDSKILRQLLGIDRIPDQPDKSTFGHNRLISQRTEGFQPEHYLTIYSKNGLKPENYIYFTPIANKVQNDSVIYATAILNNANSLMPLDLLQTSLENVFKNATLLIQITAFFTFIIIAFILIVLINIVVEENKGIMATLKGMGYSNFKIMNYVLSWYLIAFAIGLGLPFLISFYAWQLLTSFIFSLTGLLFELVFSWQSIVIVILALFILTSAITMIVLIRLRRERLVDLTK
ncbi:ABC transporter permease [Spiroplasma chrysopicola]|uniref:ABC3 transporter permease C-terminal domain-containing protein n=1 Tax=Spiroplasma chrysopicola DF-1 TaxID=1276227 RepID=R4UIF0_9MOLU|nr:ABC transporter permease [Spiroplasma chrysopicola]AGM25091.1 hypothetical protein SCHRY_v1c05130 [Spiroplasma chrysopicola DF-1]